MDIIKDAIARLVGSPEGERCGVCENEADEDGMITHGRGCYCVDEDGGGESSGHVPRPKVETSAAGNAKP